MSQQLGAASATPAQATAPTGTAADSEPDPQAIAASRRSFPLWLAALFLFPVNVLTLWPFWLELWPGEATRHDHAFMLRDMMVPHTMQANDLVFGVDHTAPRALPQDTFLAITSSFIPSTVLVSCLIIFAAFAGSHNAVRIAREMANAHPITQLLAGVFVLWNPFIIERFLQGQWSVALAAFMLPAIAYFSASGLRGCQILSVALAAITPTGALLGIATALVFERSWRGRLITLLTGAALCAPWMLVALVNGVQSHSGNLFSNSAGAEVFAPRSDANVGVLGSLVSLGGIWNAGAVPPSRGLLSGITGIILFVLLLTGVRELWRVYRTVVVATLTAVVVPALLATPWGVKLLGVALSSFPGVAIFRDTHKLVALAIPGMVLLLVVALEQIRQGTFPRWCWRILQHRQPNYWLSAAAMGLLIVSTVPAYPADMSPLQAQSMSPAWPSIRTAVSAAPSSKTLLLPPGNYRMRPDGQPVVDPALKVLPGHPIDPGFLVVDQHVVDGDEQTIQLLRDTLQGRDRLAESGVGWVLVDQNSAQDPHQLDKATVLLSNYQKVVDQAGYQLYRIPQPVTNNQEGSFLPAQIGMGLYWVVAAGASWITLWMIASTLGQHRRARQQKRELAASAVAKN